MDGARYGGPITLTATGTGTVSIAGRRLVGPVRHRGHVDGRCYRRQQPCAHWNGPVPGRRRELRLPGHHRLQQGDHQRDWTGGGKPQALRHLQPRHTLLRPRPRGRNGQRDLWEHSGAGANELRAVRLRQQGGGSHRKRRGDDNTDWHCAGAGREHGPGHRNPLRRQGSAPALGVEQWNAQTGGTVPWRQRPPVCRFARACRDDPGRTVLEPSGPLNPEAVSGARRGPVGTWEDRNSSHVSMEHSSYGWSRSGR